MRKLMDELYRFDRRPVYAIYGVPSDFGFACMDKVSIAVDLGFKAQQAGVVTAVVPHPFAAPLPPMNICACGRVFARRARRNIFVLVLGIFSAFIGLCRFPSRQGERRVRRTFKPPSF